MSGQRSTSASSRSVTSCRHEMKRRRSPVVSSRRLCFGSICQRSKRRLGGRGERKPVKRTRSNGERTGLPARSVTPCACTSCSTSGVISVSRVSSTTVAVDLRRSDDGQRHSRRSLRRQDEARAAGEQDRLVEHEAHRLLRERLRSDQPRRRAVLDDERVHLVHGGSTAHRLPSYAHRDRGEARQRDDRLQHDAQRVGRLRGDRRAGRRRRR